MSSFFFIMNLWTLQPPMPMISSLQSLTQLGQDFTTLAVMTLRSDPSLLWEGSDLCALMDVQQQPWPWSTRHQSHPPTPALVVTTSYPQTLPNHSWLRTTGLKVLILYFWYVPLTLVLCKIWISLFPRVLALNSHSYLSLIWRKLAIRGAHPQQATYRPSGRSTWEE